MNQQTAVILQSGSIYTWGKPAGDKPRLNDYVEYSTPYVMFEEK
jgi:hypothetical protein